MPHKRRTAGELHKAAFRAIAALAIWTRKRWSRKTTLLAIWLGGVLLLFVCGIWSVTGIRWSDGIVWIVVKSAAGLAAILVAAALLIFPGIYLTDALLPPFIPKAVLGRRWVCGSCGRRMARQGKHCYECGSADIRRD